MAEHSILKTVIQPKSSASLVPALPGGYKGMTDPKSGDQPDSARDMETLLSLMLENAPVAMALFDHEMRYIMANRSWVAEFGLSNVAALAGRSQYELFPSLHPAWRQIYDQALGGQVVRTQQDGGDTPEGQKFITRWEVRPWKRQSDGSVGGLMVTCEKHSPSTGTTATPTTATPESKAAPRNLFSQCLASSSLPMVALDAEGVILEANRGAVSACLARGLQEGRSHFWEAFGNGRDPAFKQHTLESLARLSGEGAAMFDTLSAPASSESGEGEKAAPTRWLLSAGKGEGADARFIAIGLPASIASAQTLTVQMPPVATVTKQASVADSLNAIALRQIEEQLNKSRQEISQLRATEQTFAKREARQRAVMESLPGGILVLDERGTPVFQNKNLTVLTGRAITRGESVEEWLAQGCPTQEHGERVRRIWREDVWRRQLKKVISLVTSTGHLKDLLFQPSPLNGGGIVITVTDATEECRAEEALRSTEAKFRSLTQECPLGIVLVDKAGAVFEVNAAAESLLGRSKAELRRMPQESWMTEAASEERKAAIREMIETGRRSTSLDISLVKEDGGELSVNLRLAMVQDAGSKPHCLIYFLREKTAAPSRSAPQQITAPVTPDAAPAAAATAHSEEETTGVTSPAWLLQTDVHGRITQWSPQAEALFGFSTSEAVGHWLHTLFRPSDATGFYAELQSRIAADVTPFDWSYFGNEGRRGTARFTLRPAADGALSADLFEEKQAPAPMRHTAQPVTRDPHTHIVKPSQLWPVADLDREKLLLSETHHRIKNHLQIISSMLNLQINTMTDATARSALRSSQNRVRSIASLHQHLYQLALGESQDFAEFAQGLIQRLREAYDVAEERVPLTLALDTANIQQEWLMPLALILNETISNAFEHAFPAGRGGKLAVHLSLTGPAGVFEIADDGVGLPEGFNPTIAPGLGLKILGVFAEQMGGELALTGAPDQGTKFNLRFPIAYADN